MTIKTKKNQIDYIEIETSDLSHEQIRMVKTANSIMSHLLSADTEKEFFNSSSELLRVIAILIKKSNFNKEQMDSPIDYEKQVLEFCADTLIDQIHAGKLSRFDN